MTTTDFHGLVPPDLAKIRSLSRNWRSWQGLYAVLWGAWTLLPFPRGFAMLELIALLLGTVAIRRYYERALGLLQPDEAKQSKWAWIALALVVAVITGSTLFVMYSGRPIPRLPPAVGPLVAAIGMVIWWRVTQREHSDILIGSSVMVAWAATLAGLPIPPRLAESVGDVLFGCIWVVHGLRTHFALMRFVRSMQARAGVGTV